MVGTHLWSSTSTGTSTTSKQQTRIQLNQNPQQNAQFTKATRVYYIQRRLSESTRAHHCGASSSTTTGSSHTRRVWLEEKLKWQHTVLLAQAGKAGCSTNVLLNPKAEVCPLGFITSGGESISMDTLSTHDQNKDIINC